MYSANFVFNFKDKCRDKNTSLLLPNRENSDFQGEVALTRDAMLGEELTGASIWRNNEIC